MKLEELKRKIYKPEAEFEERMKRPEVFQQLKEKEKAVKEEWQEIEKKKLLPKQKRYLKIGLLLAGIIFLVIVGLLFWRGLVSFDKDKVDLEIKGPERVISGEEVEYIVKYKNNTRLDLKDVKLVFYYPEDSIVTDEADLVQTIELPNLAAGQDEQTELKVRIIGLKGEIKKARTELNYQPGNISSRFTNQAEFESAIISVPLAIDFDLPERLVSGQSFDFSLRYSNQGDVAFDDIQVRIDYPFDFSFQSAEPHPLEKDKIWSLGNLMAGQEGKIFIRGSIQGEEEQVKSFKAQLGILKNNNFILHAETVSAVRISVSPLFVSQTANGMVDYIVQTGQTLNYQIVYKNTTDVGIKNVVITSKLEGQAFDLATLELDSASFDGASQTITWNTSNLPALAFLSPHQEGQVGFSITIKDPLSIKHYTDKNFIVTNTVKIDSSEIPLSLGSIQIAGQSQLTFKIASRLTIQARGYYKDDLIANSGPIPPKVGQTTTYTIKWRLINTTNDLKGVIVEAFLPPHIQWLGRISPADANLKYNSQTGKLIWQVGDLPSATGVLLPVKQTAFQVAITPSLAHLGGTVELIGQSKVTGQDDFIGLQLIKTDGPIDTDLPDDPFMGHKGGIVVE